jgi:hypothetical protein
MPTATKANSKMKRKNSITKQNKKINDSKTKDVAFVVFNTKSLKYHDPTCEWAINYPYNCINISKSNAILKGGIPCSVCGGLSREKAKGET